MAQNDNSGFIPESLSGFITDDEVQSQTSSVKQDGAYTETLLSNQGAMSDTYRRTLDTGKIEIVKRIKAQYKDNKNYMRLFVQEFSNLDGLNNENIVRTYKFDKDERGLWYSMEYVDGKTLSEIINKDLIPDIKDKLDILRQILNALVYIHDKGLIHRDLKPDNIMVSNKNRNVKIIDFGLAVADAFEDKLLQAGTPRYMSPEQRRNAKEIDKRSDIYAFGVIMKEFLTEKYASIPQYHDIIEKCLSENPDTRYQNCTNILNDLKGKVSTIPSAVKTLILDIVDDGIITPIEQERLQAEIAAFNLDEHLVYKEMQYQLEKVLERKRRSKRILLIITILIIVVGIIASVVYFINKPSENKVVDNKDASEITTSIDSKTEIEPQPQPEPEPQPQPEFEPEQPVIQPETPNTSEPSKPKTNLDYGNFDGNIVDGEPDGYGILIYTKEHLLSKHDLKKRKAMPGDKVTGTYENGNLNVGEIIRKDGTKELFMP